MPAAAGRARQRPAPAAQSRQPGFELRELHLGLALATGRMLGENVEDHRGAVHHLHLGGVLERTALAGRQIVVDDDRVGLLARHHVGDLLGLAGPNVGGRIGAQTVLQQAVAHHGAGGFGERRQLAQGFLGRGRGGDGARPHADQHDAFKAHLAVFDLGDVLQFAEAGDVLERIARLALLPDLVAGTAGHPGRPGRPGTVMLVEQHLRLVGQHAGQHRLVLHAADIVCSGIGLGQWHLCCW